MPLFGAWTLPAMRFGVPISERKTAPAIMVGSRSVNPLGMFHPEGKGRIVKVVDVFVNKDPEHGRARCTDGRELTVGEPG